MQRNERGPGGFGRDGDASKLGAVYFNRAVAGGAMDVVLYAVEAGEGGARDGFVYFYGVGGMMDE
ncbi:hypothetical protein PORY_001704 [Pneumocystis oryctolagi]|uniref:Uncharacterized protein n=1 Tax=Pneumocystis oryctolagi TaxID=42067 RepID=A0ACB7CHW6_9ASCO|nr:hypothetical protein PORY_001704 [Pneumocystis oryctolagi]